MGDKGSLGGGYKENFKNKTKNLLIQNNNMEVFILVMSVLGLIKLEIRIEGPNPFQEPMKLYLLKESVCECVHTYMYV